jgi:hypothetical protein
MQPLLPFITELEILPALSENSALFVVLRGQRISRRALSCTFQQMFGEDLGSVKHT